MTQYDIRQYYWCVWIGVVTQISSVRCNWAKLFLTEGVIKRNLFLIDPYKIKHPTGIICSWFSSSNVNYLSLNNIFRKCRQWLYTITIISKTKLYHFNPSHIWHFIYFYKNGLDKNIAGKMTSIVVERCITMPQLIISQMNSYVRFFRDASFYAIRKQAMNDS